MAFRRLTLLLCALLTPPALAAEPSPEAPLDAPARARILESALATIRTRFYSPEKGAQVEKALRQKMKQGAFDGATTSQQLAEALDAQLKATKVDGHLGAFYTPRTLPPSMPLPWEMPPAEMRKRQESLRPMLEANNFGVQRVQRLDGNVGYLHLNAFAMAELGGGEAALSAMKLLNATDALIVDLRGNGGGDPETVALYLGWLFPRQEPLEEYVYQARPPERVTTPRFVASGHYGDDKPVYVLTDGKTLSAGETFAYNVQAYQRGTLVGETTAGAANVAVGLPAGEHIIVSVPMGEAVHPLTKKSWEGVGVKPDVAVKAEEAFTTAYRAALTKLAARTDDANRAEEAREALAALKPGARP